MSGVSEIDAALVRALIAAILQTYHTLAGPQLLLREVAYILVRFFGTDAWFAVITRLIKNATQLFFTIKENENVQWKG